VCYNGAHAAAAKALQPLQRLGSPCSTRSSHGRIISQHLLDGVTPAGDQYYGKSHFMAGLDDDAIVTLIAHFSQVFSPLSVVVFQQPAEP
jgi:hypothetical protein